SAGLRDGPLARVLEGQVRSDRHLHVRYPSGVERTLVRVSKLFPWSRRGPLPLRVAFVLDAVAERAAVPGFRPGAARRARAPCMASDTSTAWAASPGRDLVLWLSVMNLLSGLRCHLLRRGTPDETAALIEAVMMEDA